MATVALSGIITPTNVVTATSTTTLTNKTLTGAVVNGTVGATTPSTVVATTVKASTTMGVGGATPSASGSGISFPATQSASSDANTLDDYEEGTFTPTVRGASTAGTYTLNNVIAYYTKVGNQVTCWAKFGFSAASGGTGEITIESLPFSYKASSSIAGSIITNSLNTSAASSNGMVVQNTTAGSAASLFIALNIDNALQEEVASGAVTTSTTLLFTVTYTVS
jgi:hypothetical protein